MSYVILKYYAYFSGFALNLGNYADYSKSNEHMHSWDNKFIFYSMRRHHY